MTRSIAIGILLCAFLTPALAADSLSEAKTLTPQEINTLTNPHKLITVRSISPTFTIRLAANGSKGYQWFLADYNPRLVKLLGQQYTAKPPGASGISAWDFQLQQIAFIAPQVTTITLEYRHEMASKAVKQQTFTIISGADR